MILTNVIKGLKIPAALFKVNAYKISNHKNQRSERPCPLVINQQSLVHNDNLS